MKSYLYLIFIMFSLCVDANEMDAPLSYFEFRKAVQDLHINNQADYVDFFITEGKELGFPSVRQIPQIYPDEWKGWGAFRQNGHNNSQDSSRISIKKSGSGWMKYNSFIILMRAEGIDNSEDYRSWYVENRDVFNVPEYPEEAYPKFQNWERELQESQLQSVQKPNQKKRVKTINKRGTNNHKKRVTSSHQVRKYLSYTELQQKVQALGITSQIKYYSRYKEIPGAPSRPDQIYEEWEGWRIFLGARKYLSYTELQQKVQALGITSQIKYYSRYKEIPGAPSSPDKIYEGEWEGWRIFLGARKYLSYKELKDQVQALGITSQREYKGRYKEIPGAPFHPDRAYKTEWKGWLAFLGLDSGSRRKRQYISYTELKKQVRALGITSQRKYKRIYKEIAGAPSNPNRQYKGEWESWFVFLGKQCKEQFR